MSYLCAIQDASWDSVVLVSCQLLNIFLLQVEIVGKLLEGSPMCTPALAQRGQHILASNSLTLIRWRPAVLRRRHVGRGFSAQRSSGPCGQHHARRAERKTINNRENTLEACQTEDDHDVPFKVFEDANHVVSNSSSCTGTTYDTMLFFPVSNNVLDRVIWC